MRFSLKIRIYTVYRIRGYAGRHYLGRNFCSSSQPKQFSRMEYFTMEVREEGEVMPGYAKSIFTASGKPKLQSSQSHRGVPRTLKTPNETNSLPQATSSRVDRTMEKREIGKYEDRLHSLPSPPRQVQPCRGKRKGGQSPSLTACAGN